MPARHIPISRISALFVATLCFVGHADAAKNEIGRVDHTAKDGTTTITLRGSETPTFSVFKLTNPSRIVVDVANARLASVARSDGAQSWRLNTWAVASVRAHPRRSKRGSMVRVVVELSRASTYTVKAKGNYIVVRVTAHETPPPTDDALRQRLEAEASRAKAAALRARAQAERADSEAAHARKQAERARAEAARAKRAEAKASATQQDLARAKEAVARAQRAAHDSARARKAAARAHAAAVRAAQHAKERVSNSERGRLKAIAEAERARETARASVTARRAAIEDARAARAAARASVTARRAAVKDAQRAKREAAEAARLAATRTAALRTAQRRIELLTQESKRSRQEADRARKMIAAAQRDAQRAQRQVTAERARADSAVRQARTEAETAKRQAAQSRAQSQKRIAEAQATIASAKQELAKAASLRSEAKLARADAARSRAVAEKRAKEARRAERRARKATLVAQRAAKRASQRRAQASGDAASKSRALQVKADRAYAKAEARRQQAEDSARVAESRRAAAEAAARKAEQRRNQAVASLDQATQRTRRAEQQRAEATNEVKQARRELHRAETRRLMAITAAEEATASANEARKLRVREEAALRAARKVRLRAESRRKLAADASDKLERLLHAAAKAEQELQRRRAAAETARAEADRFARARDATKREISNSKRAAKSLATKMRAAEKDLERRLAAVERWQGEVGRLSARRDRAAKELDRYRVEAQKLREQRQAEEKRLADVLNRRAHVKAGAEAQVRAVTTRVRNVSFTEKNGMSRVAVELSAPAKVRVVASGKRRAILEVAGVSVAKKLERTLDTSKYRGAIRAVSSYRDPRNPKNLRVVVDLNRRVRGKLTRLGNNYYWDFGTQRVASRAKSKRSPALRATSIPSPVVGSYGAISKPITQQTVSQFARKRRKVYRGRRVDLDFSGVPINDVLRLLSTVGNVDIVTPEDINKNKVTIRLRQVPWDEALEVILASQSLGYRRTGKIYRIDNKKKLDEEDEQEAKRLRDIATREAPEPEILVLNYSDANDVSTQLKSLKSPNGRIEIDKRTNALIVNDVRANRRRIIDLARRLDTPTPQIQIEARIVESRKTYIRDIGIQWGGNVIGSQATGNDTGLVFPNSFAVRGGADDSAANTGGVSAVPTDFAVNMPSAVGAGSGGALGVALGSVGGNFGLNLRLSALEDKGKVRIVSAPKIKVVNNKSAEILQGVSIPISVTGASGVNTRFVPADLSLKVTPHVSQRDCSVSLSVDVTKNEADFVNTGARGDPTILRKVAKTTILVGDGETSVIGGIYTRNSGVSYSKVPFFADLPLVGWLFKKRRENDERTEMLIFITPKITNRAFLRCE